MMKPIAGAFAFFALTLFCGERLSAGDQPTDGQSRETIISVMAWATSVGHLNGRCGWQSNRYRYQREKDAGGAGNYPLEPSISIPGKAPAIGSAEFYALQYEAALADLKLMKEANFDVAAYDMLPMPNYDPAKPLSPDNEPLCFYMVYLQWIKAAEKAGMKIALFPDGMNRSGDCPNGFKPSVAQWVEILGGAIGKIPDSPAVWKVDGKKAVFHFATWRALPGETKPDGEWASKVMPALRSLNTPFYFIADVKIHREEPSDWRKFADAVYDFQPSATRGWMKEQQQKYAKESPVPYIWISSPGYYNLGVGAFTQPDFERIHDAYIGAIKSGARHMDVLTWNDLAEDTDIWPSANKGRALLDIYSFYNKWFKSGKQPAPDGRIIVAYPKEIVDRIATKSTECGPWPAPGNEPRLIYWANLGKTAKLEVPGIGGIELQSGVSMGSLGKAKEGPMAASVDGVEVELPAIHRYKDERSNSGLRFRYVDLSQLLAAKQAEVKQLQLGK